MSISMVTTILGLSFFFQPQPPQAVHFPTSDAIDVARSVARDLGYPIDRYRNLYFFDVVTAEGGKPLIAGYTAISFWSAAHPLQHFKINERTGQVVDDTSCEVFDFPDLKVLERARQRLTGSRPSTTEELANEIGCDKLTVIRKPVVPSTKSAPPKK